MKLLKSLMAAMILTTAMVGGANAQIVKPIVINPIIVKPTIPVECQNLPAGKFCFCSNGKCQIVSSLNEVKI
jgi:hypothetical protein